MTHHVEITCPNLSTRERRWQVRFDSPSREAALQTTHIFRSPYRVVTIYDKRFGHYALTRRALSQIQDYDQLAVAA